MATIVTFNGVSYSVPAVNEEDWESLSSYLIALAGAVPSGGPIVSNIRISTAATTAVAVTDYAILINRAGAATVNLPAGADGQVFVIADVSNAAATNNITINRAGGNTILGGTSLVLDRNNEVVILGFKSGNWYRIGQALPNSLSGPNSSIANGLVAFSGTSGRQIQDLGVGTANQVLKTDGTTPSFGLIVNANVDASAAIAYSKLSLSNSIVNADISNSAAIAYSKLNLTGNIVNADIGVSAAIAYSKLALSNSILNADINASAGIAYSKLNLASSIVNADISGSAAIAYSKLSLTGNIVNSDINASAAIAYSKLALTGSIVNADINASAAIARNKIASGSASHVIVNDGSGVLSSVATLPVSQGGTGLNALGSALQVFRVNAAGTATEFATLAAGSGDVVGPGSSVTNGIVQFASTTGAAIKDLGVGSANQVLLTDGTAPSFGQITNAYVSNSAAIAVSKLATLTASRAVATGAGGFIEASAVTATELGYLSGVSSAVQTQLNAKANLSGATFSGAVSFSAGISGNVAFDTNTLFVDATNNAVGIGTITPESFRFGTGGLEVIYSAANVAALALISGGSSFSLIQFGYGSGPSELARGQIRYNPGTDKFSFYTAETERAGLDTAGQFSLIAISNQLSLHSGVNQLTLNSGTSAAARTYSFPDVGTTGTFAMLEGAQTFTGAKAFSGGITGNVAFDTTTLFVNATNDRVGVGTASPNVLFEVSSATGVTPTAPTEIRISTTTDGSGWSTSAPWGRLGFYSADGSSGGAKLHWTVDTIANSSTGGISRLTFNAADATTGVLTEVGSWSHTGAVTWGPASADSISHVLNGSMIVTTAPSNAFSSGIFKSIGSTACQILMGDGTDTTDDIYIFGGGYFNGTSHYGQNTNTVLTRVLIRGTTANSSSAFRISKQWNGSYTSTAQTTTLNTEVQLLDVTADGDVTLGPSTFTGNHLAYGGLVVGATDATTIGTEGVFLGGSGATEGYIKATRDGAVIMAINRITNDGELVAFYQAGTQEGAISVSGTTVTYGGGHLARWSQFENKATPIVLPGTVLSSTGKMATWDNEENSQLTCSKISGVPGDVTVSGIFQEYDTSDHPDSCDFWVAETGDYIIRIAQGVIVKVGDLLESAGDGTARPQSDTIVRSSTIAKAMSTNPHTVYHDGSYCIACLLML